MDSARNRANDVPRGEDSRQPAELEHERRARVGGGQMLGQFAQRVLRCRGNECARHYVAGAELISFRIDDHQTTVSSAATFAPRTMRTGRRLSWSTPRETLPISALAMAPCPREPTTIRSASIVSA